MVNQFTNINYSIFITLDGTPLGEIQYTDNPGTLLNKPFYFKVTKKKDYFNFRFK